MLSPKFAHDCKGDDIAIALIDAVVPFGGLMAVFYEVFVDESGTDPAIAVAGYVFRSDKAKQLIAEYRPTLAKYGLGAFHMVDCVHQQEEFEALSKDECIDAEIKLIELTRALSEFGFSISLTEKDYERYILPRDDLGSAYSFCLRHALISVRWWADRFAGSDDKIAYFFEAGHASQSESNSIMNRLFLSEDHRRNYRYMSHTFADKSFIPLGCADLLAWLWFNNVKRIKSKNFVTRKDLAALVRPDDRTINFTPDILNEMGVWSEAAEFLNSTPSREK